LDMSANRPLAVSPASLGIRSSTGLLAKLRIGDEKYPALTGVRALGASVVFFQHFPLREPSRITLNVMAFFFALSGFLIVRIYYQQAELTRKWLARYFVNRFARIYPVYFLLLTVAVLVQHESRPWVLTTNYTLTHALFHKMHLVIEPSWSLTVEECFYFLAPVFMLLVRIGNFFASFLFGCLLLVAALLVSTLGIDFLGTPGFVLTTTFFGNFVEFFAGVYVAFAVMNLEKKKGSVHAAGSKYTLAGLAGTVVLCGAMIGVYRHGLVDARALIALVLINNFLLPLPIAVLYWGLIREDTMLSRFLSSKLCGLLARGSYSFYLLHTLIIHYVSLPMLTSTNGYRPLYVGVTFVVTWLIAILLFLFYEEPLNILIRQRFRSKIRWAEGASPETPLNPR
jgi:peptidoglycan/LPS O-acetylase OafA/YrhL